MERFVPHHAGRFSPDFRMIAVLFFFASASILMGGVGAAAQDARPDHERPNRENFHLTDRTLVAWATPSDLDQTKSGVMAVQENSRFDAIVFGEVAPRRWMPGSDFLRRTSTDQETWAAETVTTAGTGGSPQDSSDGSPADAPLCLAIAYRGNTVAMYRNGVEYCRYQIGSPAAFGNRTEVVAGVRLADRTGVHGPFAGTIDEIRLYDVALTPEQIASLSLHAPPEPAPLAAWTFENGSLRDRCGLFLEGELRGNAKIEDGKLVLTGGGDDYFIAGLREAWKPREIQTGFYTPRRVGALWDTWIYYHDGTYYQYYLAGYGGRWDSFELATSTDGVHWKQHDAPMIRPREGTTWMGTGHIIEGPGFDAKPNWIMNYSEWFGDRQDIMFAVSDDLVNWTKVDDSNRFVQDTRWYHAGGRWDCIDAYRDGDTYCGYYTADPDPSRNASWICGFGTAESRDGIHWEATEPVHGNITGEFGGIQKIGEHFYITISEGRIARGDSPCGPFRAQTKNPNMFGAGFDIYFPRFSHNPPVEKTPDRNGTLVNHFCTGGSVYAAPLKAVEIDDEGILRLKWWAENDRLKKTPVAVKWERANDAPNSDASPYAPRFLDRTLDLERVGVVELNLALSDDSPEKSRNGLRFERDANSDYVLLFSAYEAVFGTMNRDGSDLKIDVRCNRDKHFGTAGAIRIVFFNDIMEAYLNDYLVMQKRLDWTGRLGIADASKRIGEPVAWTAE